MSARKILSLPSKVRELRQLKGTTLATQRIRGRALQTRNERYLHLHPLCKACEAQGKVTAAQEVDHVIPLHLGGVDAWENLQGLCCDCHQIKTSQEAAGRAATQRTAY